MFCFLTEKVPFEINQNIFCLPKKLFKYTVSFGIFGVGNRNGGFVTKTIPDIKTKPKQNENNFENEWSSVE
jgi:hypothetical protein